MRWLLCVLFGSLVDSQPVPYISFMGETLSNHSYVDLSLVGDPVGGGEGVQCHTDLQPCCSSDEDGIRSGDWYYPDEVGVRFASDTTADIYMQRGSQRVELRRREDTLLPSGVYRCEIPIKVIDEINDMYSSVKERVYVGVYGSGGDITISNGVRIRAVSNLMFILTCVSTGGPATSVTWTRDSDTVTEGTETVLDDPETAQYTHTLTGSREGEYTCTVTNNKPSTASASYNVLVLGEPNISVDRRTSTSIFLSWRVPSVLGVTSYEVIWQRDTTPECPDDMDEGNATISSTVYCVDGLEEDSSYTITVIASNAESSAISNTITAMTGEAVPSGPPTSVSTISTSTTIAVLWEPVDCIHHNGVITGYVVLYGEEDTEGEKTALMISVTKATITGLMPSTIYTIQVAAVNSVGTGLYSDVLNVPTEHLYFSLNGDIIPNHGYVMISDIGSTSDTALLCRTNRPSKCDNANSGGNWFAPNGTRVNLDDVPGFTRNRGVGIVRLFKNTGNPSEGIYSCVVEDATFTVQTLSVGLYNVHSREGNVTLFGDMTLIVDSDLNGTSPQFTLNCISTGGPATTVTWTRDSVPVTEGTETVLDDPVTAQYTHTLTGSTAGEYTCTVTNNKPSSDSAGYTVPATGSPTNVMAVQESANSIRVSWSPSSDATGYIISYGTGHSSGRVTISGGSIDNYLLFLQNRVTYTISIVATSQEFPSDAVVIEVTLDSSNTVSHLATDNTVVVIGGVVIGSFTTAMTVIVVVVIVSRTCTRCTSAQKRDPDGIPTSSNEAYHTVNHSGETTVDNKTVSNPHAEPPSTSSQSTAEDYECVKLQ